MSARIAIFTEAEAKERLCHQTLSATVVAGEANYYPATCQSSVCMAWRWYETHIRGRDADGAPTMILNGETYGYCGLAGSPRPILEGSK